MTTTVVRLDRLQAGLSAALLAVHPTATVVWAPSEFPRASAGALVFACRLLAGPDADPLGGDAMPTATLPTRVTIRILAATVSNSILVLMSGRRFEAATTGDVETTRDALLTALLERTMVDATIEPDDIDGIVIEALEFGDLYKVAVHASESGLVSLTVNETETGLVQTTDVRSYVEVQAYSTNRFPRTGAAAALNRFRGRMRLPSVADVFEAHGLGVVGSPGRVVTLDALAGPTWQSRSALSFWVAQLSLAAETGRSIETVRGNVYARGAGAPIQVPIETEDPTP